MRTRTFIALLASLAAAAVAGMVVVQLDAKDTAAPAAAPAAASSADGLSLGGGGSDAAPTIIGSAANGRGLMSPAPGHATRIVPVLSWDVQATSPLLQGRDCVASPARCHNGLDHINLVYGAPSDIPAKPMRATVLSDSGSQPDAVGASHCLNRMRLASGAVIAVRNDHRLANEPCLAPGEHIIVAPGATAHTLLPELRRLAADKGGTWPSEEGIVRASCVISDAGLKRAGITRAQLSCTKSA